MTTFSVKKQNLEKQIKRITAIAVLKFVAKTRVDIEKTCRIWEEKSGRKVTEVSKKEITRRLITYMRYHGINLIIQPNLKK
jgi:L-arabinose isomerase